MDKAQLRQFAKATRQTLDIKVISLNICEKIRLMPEFIQAKNVLLYYPMKQELDLLGLCAENKKFYLPKIDGENLKVCSYECGVKLELSKFRTFEPCSDEIEPNLLDFVIVPCLMADRAKYRLGYGGGFYDRFLSKLKKECVKISAVPEQLLCAELPTENHDLKLDFIVTENKVF